MKRSFLWALVLVLTSIGYAQAQSTITGKITNERTGEAVPFASVVVKGTEIGITADDGGAYSLSAPANAVTLVFSSIGFNDLELEIGGRSVINVQLTPSAESLDEVIVVAYGTATRSTFTGSASSLKSDKIAMRTVSNLSNALSGQLAGVQVINSGGGQPGTNARIRIRGVGSMYASNDPLYVIDGVPVESNSINSINPQDIESMTVLKDAAANAVYGARGANGVILVTTKRGTSRDATIMVDAKWGTNRRAVPNYNVMTDPAMYYETYYKGMYNSKYYTGATTAESFAHADNVWLDAGQGGLGYLIYTVPEGERVIGTNFKLNPNATLGYSDGDYFYTPDDWYKELFDSNNLRQEYNVSISGMSDKMNYYVSGSFLDDSGIIPNSGFERYTGLAKVDYQAKDWLKVGSNVSFTYSNQHSPTAQTTWGSSGNAFYAANMIAPIYPMYVRNADGSIKKDFRGITVYDFGNSTNFKRAFLAMSNPGIVMDLDKYDNRRDVINSKWYAILTPVEGLTITANLGVNNTNRRQNVLYNPFYGGSVGTDGYAYVAHDRLFTVNQQYMAAYKKSFSKHTVEVKAGYEKYSLIRQILEGSNTMLYNPWVPELGNAIKDTPNVDSKTNRYITQGIIGIAQYDYDGKYFLSASYRRDASSRFHPDHRWGNFGSVGGAWLMNKENFMQDISWIDMLKFKASYGIQGNDNLLSISEDDYATYYAYADQYQILNNNGDYAVLLSYKGNKEITWETSYSFNTGFDFDLFDGRLSGTIEYYSRKTKDLLYHKPVPVSAGFSTMPENIGSIVNRGIEADLSGIIVRTKDIEWSVNANITYWKNKITELSPDLVEKGGQKTGSRIWKVGGTLYNSYLPVYAGVDETTGKATYYVDPDNDDWTITDDYAKAQQSDLGATNPKFFGGFGTQLNAFGFDLSVQFSYQLGGKLYDGSYEALMHNGDGKGHNWHMDILNAWTPENTHTDVPRLNSGDISYQIQSSRFLVNSNYLALNNVTLGYTLPKSLIEKIKLTNVRVYVTGENLGLFSKRKGFDPRMANDLGLGASTTSGNFKYSTLRSISGGISLTF